MWEWPASLLLIFSNYSCNFCELYTRENFIWKVFFILLTLGCTSGFSPLPPHVSYGWREMHFARLRSSAQAQENNFTQENREFHLNKILHIYSQPAVLEKQIERKRQNNWIKNKLHYRSYLRLWVISGVWRLWAARIQNVWKWPLNVIVPRASMW